MNAVKTFVSLIAFLAILGVGTLIFVQPAKAGYITDYDLNSDGCVTRTEVDTVVSGLAPEAEALVDDGETLVLRAPNQTSDMMIKFEDGCAVDSELIAKDAVV